MSLFHEAYLFQPRDFTRVVLPYVRDVTTSSHSYARLRADAIRLYDSNQQVRDLADEYGGWDRQGIMTAFPERHPDSLDDTAFWVRLLLYGHLTRLPDRRLGLDGYGRLLDKVLTHLGWNDARRGLLIKGRDFNNLEKERVDNPGRDNVDCNPTIWDHVARSFQSGSAGWLTCEDDHDLLQHLTGDQQRIGALPDTVTSHSTQEQNIAQITTDQKQLDEAYHSAIDMLRAALEQDAGLCIIISG
jgi:hypothetical protein